MADTLTIRTPLPADAGTLATLFTTAVPGRSHLPPELLAWQEDAQRQQWTQRWDAQGESLVECGGTVAARIWLAWRPASVRLVDLTVLPSWQGQGIGGRLLSGLCAAADAAGVPVALSVAADNAAALHLYGSFGFLADAGTRDGLYLGMVRPPEPTK